MSRVAWQAVPRSQADALHTGADWSDPGTDEKKLDPHLMWAEACGFAGFALTADNRVRVAIELEDPLARKSSQQQRLLEMPGLEIAPAHVEQLKREKARFVTATCPVGLLRTRLAPEVKRLKPGLVGSASTGVETLGAESFDWPRVRASLNRRDPSPAQQMLRQLPRTPPERSADYLDHRGLESLRDALHADAPPSEAKAVKAKAPEAKTPWIGIIDFGCAFAHPHLRKEDGSSRVRHFWDQGRLAEWSKTLADALWRECSDFGYGRETGGAALSALLLAQADPLLDVEPFAMGGGLTPDSDAFAHWCHALAGLPELLEFNADGTHGTVVMDVAAGRGYQPDPPCQPTAGDAAGEADIVFVQLPEPAVRDLSGAWLAVYVIDAIEYILRKTDVEKTGRPLVINLSYGNFAGSHDGKSILESALEHFTSRGALIVLAAGNGPAKDRPFHAKASIAPGGSAAFEWITAARDPTQSFLELWFDGDLSGATLKLTTPDDAIDPLEFDSRRPAFRLVDLDRADPPAIASVYLARDTSAGGRSGMLLLACAPDDTSQAADRSLQPMPAGVWRIEIENAGNELLDIQAWCERDEPGNAGNPVSAQSWVRCASPAANPARLEPEPNHLTALAFANGAVSVGAVCMQIDGSIRLGRDAVLGYDRLDRRPGPDAWAPGERDSGLQTVGITAAGNVRSVSVQVQGSSISAAWFTRCAVNAMASKGTLKKGDLLALLGQANEATLLRDTMAKWVLRRP